MPCAPLFIHICTFHDTISVCLGTCFIGILSCSFSICCTTAFLIHVLLAWPPLWFVTGLLNFSLSPGWAPVSIFLSALFLFLFCFTYPVFFVFDCSILQYCLVF